MVKRDLLPQRGWVVGGIRRKGHCFKRVGKTLPMKSDRGKILSQSLRMTGTEKQEKKRSWNTERRTTHKKEVQKPSHFEDPREKAS